MWNALRASQLNGHKFRRQAVIGERIVDFFCPSKGVVVEIDGDTHDRARDVEADRAMLTAHGFRTVRYSNREVMQNLDGVLADLSLALANAPDRWAGEQSTTPRPPPLKRRGSSVGEAIRDAAGRIAVDWARIDAELLMAHALGLSRSAMLLHHMRDPVPEAFAPLLARRLASEPVAYITGHAEFYGLDLQVSPAVLIPRGDSETLIDAARAQFAEGEAPARILDLGTGSGALLLAALSLWPEAQGVALDASMPALRVAQCNARKLGMADRTRFVRRSWRKGDWQRDLGTFDLVLCNPPYVESDAVLDPCVRDHEPASALFSGAEGLDDYRILIPQIGQLLTKGAFAILEIGATQREAVCAIAENQGFSTQVRNDLAQLPRAVIVSQSF